MKLKTTKSIIASMVIFCMNISRANDYIYIVKKNDTLASILQKNKLKPVYGKHGTLEKTLKLNPKMKFSGGGNKIYPRMKIILSNAKIFDKVKSTVNSQQSTVNSQQSTVNSQQSTVNSQQPERLANDRKPSSDFEQSFYWEFAPRLSWKNLSSTDDNIYRTSKINALSEMNYGVGVTYGMHFEEGIDVYSKLALESVSFVEDSSIHLEKKNFLTSRFNMGIFYEEKWHLEIGMNDEFFLTSPSASRVEVKKISLPEINFGYQKDFYQYRSAKLSYLLSGAAVLPKNAPEINSKMSYGFGAGIEATLKNQSFLIGYDLKLLKASGNSTDNHNIFWDYRWKTL